MLESFDYDKGVLSEFINPKICSNDTGFSSNIQSIKGEKNLKINKRSISLERSHRQLIEKDQINIKNLVPVKMNLSKEIRDPGNSSVYEELRKLVALNENINSALDDFEKIKRSKSLDGQSFEKLSKKDEELDKMKYKYNCKRYFLF